MSSNPSKPSKPSQSSNASKNAETQGLRLDEIVAQLGGELVGDGAKRVYQVATLEGAGPEHISFLSNPKYQKHLKSSRAGAVILAPDSAAETSSSSVENPPVSTSSRIIVRNPYLYFTRVSQLLNPNRSLQGGVHASAVVESNLPKTVSVGAGAVIGPDCKIGENCQIGAGCVVGSGVTLGAGSVLHANVTLYDGCFLGARNLVHSGTVIGSDGFGYARDADARWVKIPQIGCVVMGDDVEVGANTSIDRGAIEDTIIEDGVKIDNQVQIAHNCRIGALTAIAGCVGIAGSTHIGKRCMIGGAAMIIGHLEICDDVIISAATFVTKSITKPGEYAGVPFEPRRDWLKTTARLRHLDNLAATIRDLETRLAGLENKK